jgi:hypothetical protein
VNGTGERGGPARASGLIVVRCPNVVARGRREFAALARTFHYICPDDHTLLRIRHAAARIQLYPCSTCGTRWWGPTEGELIGRAR